MKLADRPPMTATSTLTLQSPGSSADDILDGRVRSGRNESWSKLDAKHRMSSINATGRSFGDEQRVLPVDSEFESPPGDIFRSISNLKVPPKLKPWFRGSQLRNEYFMFQRQHTHLAPILTIFAILVLHIATHGNFELSGIDYRAKYLFTISWVLVFLTLAVVILTTLLMMLSRPTESIINYDETRGWLGLKWSDVVDTWIRFRFAELLVLAGSISSALLLIGRVLAGPCQLPDRSSSASVWVAQSCNPLAEARGIPLDQVVFMYGYILVSQLLFSGTAIEAIVVSWIISVGAVIFALVYVGGSEHLYIAIYSVLFVVASIEFERRMRLLFLHSRIMAIDNLGQSQLMKADQKLERDMLRQQQELVNENLRKDHELKLLSVAAENEKKLRETEKFQLRSLMGNVAHDLKTPLHAISGDLDVLRADLSRLLNDLNVPTAAQEQFGKLFDSVDATCHFMAMAINRSQDYMKASSNIALVPSNGTFQVSEVILCAVAFIDRLQMGRKILVHNMPPGVSDYIISDKHWLTENLMCLISNASKYSDRGTVVDVRVGLEGDLEAGNAMLHFSVEDTGIGLSEEGRANLFQPFKQAQRLAGGTGLGLYSLSKRIEALDGTCGVGTREDGKRGSVFWFKIPYRPDTAASAADLSSHHGLAVVSEHLSLADLDGGSTKCRCILVVDDTPSILKVTERLLTRNGHHQVETAENGSQALELLRKDLESGVKRFDLVLTDLQMPVMDGLEFVRRFRQLEASHGSPERQLIVGMSANSDAQTAHEAICVGMDCFISKPFKYAELKTILSSRLGIGTPKTPKTPRTPL